MSTEQKMRDLVHYICWKCDEPSQLGATKLNKILWFVDTLAYRTAGAPVTAATYVKLQYGPVPRNIRRVIDELCVEGKIVKREPQAAYQPREFFAVQPASTDNFSPAELSLIDSVIGEICKNHTAGSISELTHGPVWEAASMGEEIPLYAIFADAPGALTDADFEWANGVVEAVELHEAA